MKKRTIKSPVGKKTITQEEAERAVRKVINVRKGKEGEPSIVIETGIK